MTDKQASSILKRLEKCDGNCLHCKQFHPYFADVPYGIAMAYGCDLLPQEEFSYIADKLIGEDSLRNCAIAIAGGDY